MRMSTRIQLVSVGLAGLATAACDNPERRFRSPNAGTAAQAADWRSQEPGTAAETAQEDRERPREKKAEAPLVKPADPAKQLIGKWGIDVEKLGEIEEIRKMPEDQRKAAIEMAKGFATSMAFEFTDDSIIMDAMGKKVEGSYRVTKTDGAKLTLEATLEGKTETLEAEIKGDGVILGKGKEKFTLKRRY